jgi:hypothetical protein
MEPPKGSFVELDKAQDLGERYQQGPSVSMRVVRFRLELAIIFPPK